MTKATGTVRVAEDISILHLLHWIAVPPTSNPITPPRGHEPSHYLLPFEKERHLTIVLAYISCIKDNPSRVPALCVRENKDADRLDILVAVNKSNANDGGVLEEVGTRFQKLFKLLPSVATSDAAEQDILAEIVSMCTTRILERLRFVHETGKKPVREHLSDAIQILSRTSTKFTSAARDLIHKIDSWKKHQTTSELTKVVESAYRISQLPELPNLLDHISNRDMDPGSRSCLLNSIRKLARYRIAARTLYRIAKKFPIARKMHFVPANLPEVAFQRVPEAQQARDREISSALSRISLNKKKRKKINLCYGYLGMDQTSANEQFRQQKIKTLEDSKIHAEVQIVFYCESNKLSPPPRVISSSKDACFLCNAFINMQAKYHIPRQHGRVYPNWRLPWFPTSNKTEGKFAKHLENLIGNSIKTMIKNESRKLYPQPNESTALSVPISETTVSTDSGFHSVSASGTSTSKEQMPRPCPSKSSVNVRQSPVPLRASVDTSFPATIQKEQEEASKNEIDRGGGIKSVSLPGEGPPTILSKEVTQALSERYTMPRNPIQLVQGMLQRINVEANSSSRFYKGRSLELEIEYCASNPAQENGSRILSCNLEWLNTADAEAIRVDKDALVIKAEQLETEVSIPLNALGKWHISTKEAMFRVQI